MRSFHHIMAATAAMIVLPQAASAEDAKLFRIPAGSLGDALRAYGLQSGDQIAFPRKMVEGRRSSGVSGMQTPAAALRAILDGSGIGATRTDAGVVILEPLSMATPTGMVRTAYQNPGAAPATSTASAPAPAPAPAAEGVEDIVVTATRQSQLLSRVPISVAAFGRESMEKQGIRRVDDLVRFTPGLALSRSGSGANTISIRGITSGAGSGATGIYIDDTPIQVRNLGYGSGTAFPQIFDLERVEVLRGPQGTLFGAGSQGGTVRFIQAQPNLNDYAVYARGELAKTQNGDWSYEGGVAAGSPLVEDKIGFRASIAYRRDGGYIDAITGAPRPRPGPRPNTARGFADFVVIDDRRTIRKDTNWRDSLNVRLALAFQLSEAFKLTPSITYQKRHINDGQDNYWLAASNETRRDYARVVYSSEGSAGNPLLVPTTVPDEEEGRERFYLPALAANLDLGSVELISNTSMYIRRSSQFLEWTRQDSRQYLGEDFPGSGYKAASLYSVKQRNFAQEIRLQSTDADADLRFVVGGFFSRDKQTTFQGIDDNFVGQAPNVINGVTDGPPFGPGTSAYVNQFGLPPLGGVTVFAEDRQTVDTQYAAFGQVDFKPIDVLTVTAGLRVSRNKLDFNGDFYGPLNNLNTPGGQDCPTEMTCVPGQAPFAPGYVSVRGFSVAETSYTPKLGVSFQPNRKNLFYATASKGFRPAGASPNLPPFCDTDLRNIGYVDGSGNTTSPRFFGSDTVWSYEIGSKNRAFDGKLQIDASAYYIKWKNIQTAVSLPICLYNFVDNVGSATSKGFDLSLTARPLDGLTLSSAIGYNKAVFAEDGLTPNGTTLFTKGSAIAGGMVPWTVALNGQYDFADSYFRADYTYTSAARPQGQTDPKSPIYDPRRFPIPAYSLLNLRLGHRFGDLDASLFVQNLTNARPDLGLQPDRGRTDPVWINTTLRPRTVGLTLSYRH